MNKSKVVKPEPKTNATITSLTAPEKTGLIKEVDHLTRQVATYKIIDDATRAGATNLLAVVKSKYKEIEAKRVGIVKPIKDSVKLIEAEFNILLKPLETLESTIKAEIRRDYLDREAEANRARIKAEAEEAKKLASKRLQDKLNSDNQIERELAEAKVQQIKEETIAKAPEASRATSTGAGTASVRKIWKYEVIDFSKVPDGFKTIDSGAITGAIREGMREIDGLRIFQDVSIGGGTNF